MNIALFASGAGTNAKKMIEYFKGSTIAQIALVVCNRPQAGVMDIAEQEEIPALLISKEKFLETAYLKELVACGIDFIVLAGFLWKIPSALVAKYPRRIINIHPALLPRYGGKGMYGNAVHAAVIRAGDPESGITIHYVDEEYDHGNIILQKKCTVDKNETPESLADKVQVLEHHYFAPTLEDIIKQISA